MLVPKTNAVSYLSSPCTGFTRERQRVAAEFDGSKLTGRDRDFSASCDDGAVFVIDLHMSTDGSAVWREDCVTQTLAATKANRGWEETHLGHWDALCLD